MVCFRYIIVNTLHKGDNEDNNNDGVNNNSDLYINHIVVPSDPPYSSKPASRIKILNKKKIVLVTQRRENSVVFICPKLWTTLKMEAQRSTETSARTVPFYTVTASETEIFVSTGHLVLCTGPSLLCFSSPFCLYFYLMFLSFLLLLSSCY